MMCIFVCVHHDLNGHGNTGEVRTDIASNVTFVTYRKCREIAVYAYYTC